MTLFPLFFVYGASFSCFDSFRSEFIWDNNLKYFFSFAQYNFYLFHSEHVILQILTLLLIIFIVSDKYDVTQLNSSNQTLDSLKTEQQINLLESRANATFASNHQDLTISQYRLTQKTNQQIKVLESTIKGISAKIANISNYIKMADNKQKALELKIKTNFIEFEKTIKTKISSLTHGLESKLSIFKFEQNINSAYQGIAKILLRHHGDLLKYPNLNTIRTNLLSKQKTLQQKIIFTYRNIGKNMVLIDSKILKADSEGEKKEWYLLEQLGNPMQLRLIFRASQNQFSAKAFHEQCHGIPDTVTIIRTEFGRTIAAYTPLKWEKFQSCLLCFKPAAQDYYMNDPQKGSFLLQLDIREKMTLVEGQEMNTIFNSKADGPIFGRGADLWIGDKCNEQLTSGTQFATSYNFSSKYKNQQQSWTALTGVRSGHQFRVFEYEVFKVIK